VEGERADEKKETRIVSDLASGDVDMHSKKAHTLSST
jgi:hypothetical protein